jgi:hypothetical protein
MIMLRTDDNSKNNKLKTEQEGDVQCFGWVSTKSLREAKKRIENW